MDSDESRPGSSASVTSSSSADSNENVGNGSPASSRKSRSKSVNSNSSSSSSSRNNSIEDERRSAPSVNDADQNAVSQDGAIRSRSSSAESNQSYSSNGQNGQRPMSRNQSISPVRRNSKSSRNSSVSSVASDEDEQLKADDISDNEIDQWQPKPHNGMQRGDAENVAHDEDIAEKNGAIDNVEPAKHQDALNISHEDLSDVSDLESAVVSPSNESDKHQDDVEEVRDRIECFMSTENFIFFFFLGFDRMRNHRHHRGSPSLRTCARNWTKEKIR